MNTVAPEILSRIWAALNTPERRSTVSEDQVDQIAHGAWVGKHQLEDLLHSMDRRIDDNGLGFRELVQLAKVPVRWLAERPKNRFDDYCGSGAISTCDATSVLMTLERLGFFVDAEALCGRLRPALVAREQLTLEEIDILFYDKARHRQPPLEFWGNEATGGVMAASTKKLTTQTGYKAALNRSPTEDPISLTVRAPRYRPRPPQHAVTCAECGMTYVKGAPSEEAAHRKYHRARDKVLHPKPDRRLERALAQDAALAPWVDCLSKPWKRQLVFERAQFFRREFNYDFVQWEPDGRVDGTAIGDLFLDETGRSLGACCFRPLIDGSDAWRLDWIWMAPDARRTGLLARDWPMFRARFGGFKVARPVSDSMARFLAAIDPSAELC